MIFAEMVFSPTFYAVLAGDDDAVSIQDVGGNGAETVVAGAGLAVLEARLAVVYSSVLGAKGSYKWHSQMP